MTELIRFVRRHAAALSSAVAHLGHAMLVRPARITAVILGECITVAAFAGLGLLILAQPAFRETGPGWLRRLDLAVTFVDTHGREIGHRGIRHEDALPLDEMPPHLIAAVLATEDHRFHRHWGIDPIGLVRAIVVNAKADAVVQGGSTITQQLAKNLFLNGERTIERKINEAFLALWLEQQLSKDEILKLYLDRGYMGGGNFGIQAAARFYFGKSARDLSLAEAAMLAGLYKAPARYAPHLSITAARARASDVLDRMVDTGAIGRAEADAAKRVPAVVGEPQSSRRPDHYLDWAYREVQRLATAGRLGDETILLVETVIDPELQRKAEDDIAAALDGAGEKLRVGEAAFVALDPKGAVRAMVGGRDYARSQFNRATDALRQPGSAFKPIVYAAAMAHTHLRPGSLVRDEQICLGEWCPSNYSRSFVGALPLSAALANSLNTVAVKLSVEIGRAAGEMTPSRQARHGRRRIVGLAQDLGIRSRLHDTPSLPLGASEVTPLELTAAFAGFANGGFRAEPHTVAKVQSGRGTLLYDRERDAAPAPRVLRPEVVGDMNTMLVRAVQAGTGRRAALPQHMVGGKTGTTSAYRDAWFVGVTAHLSGGIWLGNDDFKPTKQLTGGQLPAQIWHGIMSFAHRGLPRLALPETEGGARLEADGRGLLAEVRPALGSRSRFREVRGAAGGFTLAR